MSRARRGAARAALAALCALGAGCGDAFLGPPPPRDRGALFDEVWRQFDLHYSFFELKRVNWDSLGAAHRPAALAATTDRELAAVLGRMLAELRDPHVALTPTDPALGVASWTPPQETATLPHDPATIYRRYVPAARATTGGHVRYGMAAGSVGYVEVPTFQGADWAGEIDDALAALPAATSLVIDVRDNGGGNTTNALGVAGRFTDRARRFGWLRLRDGPAHDDFTDYLPETVAPAGARRFAGRVYVLTNRRAYSAAEGFVLAMRAQPQVTVVGDTTGGASGGPITRELPNGWTYRMSEWIEYTPDRRPFEGVGLPPDVVVRATAADAARGADPVLERALALAQDGAAR